MFFWNDMTCKTMVLTFVICLFDMAIRGETNLLWCGRSLPSPVAKLLEIKDMPIDCPSEELCNWSMPTNVVVDGVQYAIYTNPPCFRVFRGDCVVGRGCYELYGSSRDARIAALVYLTALSTQPVELNADQITSKSASSDLVHFTGFNETNSCGGVCSAYKNVFLELSEMTTNKFHIAERILEEGSRL